MSLHLDVPSVQGLPVSSVTIVLDRCQTELLGRDVVLNKDSVLGVQLTDHLVLLPSSFELLVLGPTELLA